MKVCPVCKSRCFDDMEVCYGCMHQFNRPKIKEQDIPKVAKHAESRPIPEFFEVEEYPIVEDIETFMLRQTDDLANLFRSEDFEPLPNNAKKRTNSSNYHLTLHDAKLVIENDLISLNFKIV